jgi:Transposase
MPKFRLRNWSISKLLLWAVPSSRYGPIFIHFSQSSRGLLPNPHLRTRAFTICAPRRRFLGTHTAAIGVDEIQYAKGHKYLTLVYQMEQQCTRLLWIGRKRTVASFEQFFALIGEELAGRQLSSQVAPVAHHYV